MSEPKPQSKIKELGIFAIGIGVIATALTLYLSMNAVPRKPLTLERLAIPLALSAVYIALGALTLTLKNKVIIQITVACLVGGLIFDLAVGFNLIKCAITGGVVVLVVKTGMAAIEEAKTGTKTAA